MTSRPPEFTTRLRFRIGDVLPPDDQLAQWIVNLARALNDLLLANERLYVGFEIDSPAQEHFYDVRAIATHAWELARFLRESEENSKVVREFIATLPDEAVAGYGNAVEILQTDPAAESDPRRRSFQTALASARDQATHYSRLDHKLVRGAMKRISDQHGEILLGRAVKDFRADFAADLDAQMFFPMRGDEEPFREFATELNLIVGHLIKFSRIAVDQYFRVRSSFVDAQPVSDLPSDNPE